MFATKAHEGMYRKRDKTPYILHPLEAAVIVGTVTQDPEIISAAVLHDVVEDTEISMQEIIDVFGERVAMLVSSETENKREELPPEQTWKIRKQESLDQLAAAEDEAVRIVWLGDKLANVRAFYRQWKKEGDKLWLAFNQKDPAQQAWYYRSIAKLTSSLSEHPAWNEYNALVEIIFEKVADNE